MSELEWVDGEWMDSPEESGRYALRYIDNPDRLTLVDVEVDDRGFNIRTPTGSTFDLRGLYDCEFRRIEA